MRPLRFFLDARDRSRKTFPEKLTPEEFGVFCARHERVRHEKKVAPIRVHVGYTDGRVFCLNMTPYAGAVRAGYERAGLPFDAINEVTTATPGDTFVRRRAAA